MDDDRKPDALEKRVRFGGGFMFGVVAGFFFLLNEVARSMDTSGSVTIFWVSIGLIALLCGYLAMRYGDDFWRGFADWFR